MGELLREVVWPTDLATLDGASMVIREATHRFGPFSFHRAMVGARLPLLLTAMGRAYFAFCPDRERQALGHMLRAGDDPEEAMVAWSPRALAALVGRTREAGYGWNNREWSKEARFSAIALLIRNDKHVLGCLNLVFTARAMTVAEAVAKHLPALRRATDRISTEIAKAGTAFT